LSQIADLAHPDSLARSGTDVRARLSAILETTKPRITRLVTITSAVGFAMAAVYRSDWTIPNFVLTCLGTLIGTALSAAGANALNQWMERDRDARMKRTGSRPLPSGRISPATVFGCGLALSITGVACLWALSGVVPALVSLATILLYLLLYTPSKVITPTSTLIGAVPGALPPLIGWTAAAGTQPWSGLLDPSGWSLFLVMFVWQVPHFLAIAWMYREDYAAGGYRVLPVVDPSGRQTSAMILFWTLCLIPVSAAPALFMPDRLGLVYISFAVVSGLAFLYMAARAAWTRTRTDARRAFIASVIHLPVLLSVMVAQAIVTTLTSGAR
jgi:protoheme IX farnesyltransferase